MYSDDWDGMLLKLIGSTGNNNGPDFYAALAPYMSPGTQWIDPARSQRTTNTQWWHYGHSVSNPSVTQRGWPAVTQTTGTGYVRITELPNPSTTAIFMCKLPITIRPGNWYTGSMHMGYGNADYTPWPLHGNGTLTNVVRMDGSGRTYPWGHLVAYPYFPDAVPPPPPGYTALYSSVPRNYLWTGYRPGENAYAGWLDE
jgi:hypothetical protein